LLINLSLKNEKGKYPIVDVPKLVGYTFQNVGQESITYVTEEYTQNAEGIFVGTQVQKTAKPGEVFQLS